MQKPTRFARCGILVSSSILTLMMATACGTASAQEASSEDFGAAGVTDIIVRAQKRDESAQDVPISIQAIGGEQLQQMGVSNTNDLPLAIPGFQISSSAQNQLYYLRGVGSQQVGTSRPPEVATIIDGVYMPFASSALQGFSNIESIEVDKGPQGTLFGRNTTGGVIQINTKDPEHTPSGDFSIGYGNYNHVVGSGYLTFGLSDKVAASFAFLADDQMDGYGKSIASGKDVLTRSVYSVMTKWLFDLSDRTQLRLNGSYSRVKGDAGSTIPPAKGVKLWDQIANKQLDITGFYDTAQNAPTYHTNKAYAVSAQLKHDLGWAEFTSTTAYQGYDNIHEIDFDATPVVFLPIVVDQGEDVFTQELQLSSPSESTLVWTVGAFYLHQTGSTAPFRFGAPFASIVFPFGIPFGDSYDIYSYTKTDSISGYGQATATVFADTHLTLGFRFTRDKVSINGFGQIAGPSTPDPIVLPPTVGDQSVTFNEPTYRIALDHDFSPDIKVYASYNRGYQSGGFNANNAGGFTEAANPPLKPEFIDAFEVGLKTQLFDRRIRFNLAGFYYDYKNLHQQSYVGGALQTLNAGGARIKGIDFELVYSPSSDFVVGLVGEVLDAKFTEFLNAPGYTYSSGVFGEGPLVPTPIPNAKGNYLGFAPKYTGTLYATHTAETGIGTFKTSANVAYNDGYYVDPGNLYKEPSFTLVNVSEEWAPNENFSLRLWVKNLFDKKYDQSVAAVGTVGFTGNTKGAPREYGATARYKF
ncbi:MAG: TonB-dependent receptor [Novosphingobium sp.]